MNPVQRTIWLCDRDLEGRKNNCNFRCHKNEFPRATLVNEEGDFVPHWFLIISQKETQGFITALPISSQEYQVKLNNGETINDGDIKDSPDSTKTFPFTSTTYILCNKPCRIPVEDFNGLEDWGWSFRSPSLFY